MTLRGEVGETGAPVPWSPESAREEWPFVARARELAFLRDCNADPDTPGVVVAGGAGVGKSRLVREAFGGLADDGPQPLVAIATRAAASVPLGCLAHLIPGAQLARASDRLSLFNAVVSSLSGRSESGRAALVVDDAHLLDPAGAALVFHLANIRAAFVCAVVRDGETIPDAIRGLWKDAGASRIDVEPLGHEDAAELIERALGGRVDGASIRGLTDAAQGNVLFMRELVQASLETGGLTEEEGVWRWSGRIPESAALIELVEANIGRLERSERRALEVLALGEPLGARVLERLTGSEELEALERRGLIAVSRDTRREVARLGHPLYTEILGSRVPSGEARAIRLALAAELEGHGMRRSGDVLRVATWRLEAESAKDPKLLTEAARQALHAFDPELAIRLGEAALEADGGLPAALALGDALTMSNRFEEAEAALAPHEREALADDAALHYVFQRTLALHWGLGRSAEADAMLLAARPAREDPAWRQQIDGLRAQVLAFHGPLEEAVRLAEPIVEDPGADRSARLYAVSAVVTQLTLSGQTDRVAEVLAPYFELAFELVKGFPYGPSWIAALHAANLGYAGRLDEMAELLHGLIASATSVGDEQARGGALVGLGMQSMYRGDLGSAARSLREAIGPLRRCDLVGLLPVAYSGLARVEGERGDGAAARAAATTAARLGASRPDNRLHLHERIAGEAWAAAASGELSRARAIAIDAARELSELPLQEALLLVLALRLGAPAAEVAPRLVEICEGRESELLRAYGRYAAALLDGTGEAIAEVASELEQRGLLLHAAETHAAASIAFRDQGRADSARRAAARAHALVEGSCSGARTPALATLSAPELTAREQEIAELAARGLANAEIAERLVVSVRTVEWHLRQVYIKLGISRRDELPDVLGSADPVAREGEAR